MRLRCCFVLNSLKSASDPCHHANETRAGQDEAPNRSFGGTFLLMVACSGTLGRVPAIAAMASGHVFGALQRLVEIFDHCLQRLVSLLGQFSQAVEFN